MMCSVDIPYYLDFLPQTLLDELNESAESVDAIPGLRVAPDLRCQYPAIESVDALQFVCELYESVKDQLHAVLEKRRVDRSFIDAETTDCVSRNGGEDYLSENYETVIGRRNEAGEIIVGHLPDRGSWPAVSVPDFVSGYQVTLFGPPATAKMAINAMNSLNRIPADEPELVSQLVNESGQVPRWGADNEDSQTPIMTNVLRACQNLAACFDGTLQFQDPQSGREYRLADHGRAIPIKRIPGLALPDGSHLHNGSPLPLHLFDFAMHLFHNWSHPEALLFYVPKLENEGEASYFRQLVQSAEAMIQSRHAGYKPGSVRLFVVFENPRAIFRIREMAAALHPYFLGGSLGWHDFLASTARLFKHDPNYRIPVKADPNIVINHIRESHQLLVNALSPIGGISIGGMYGVLYEDDNPASYEVSMVGYIRDVVTQLKRGLHGFWVAHPAFVRTGLALVEAFRQSFHEIGQPSKNPDNILNQLIGKLVPDEAEYSKLLKFIYGADVAGLDTTDPHYSRGVLAANIRESEVVANDDPQEIRYNIFQAIQYLTDWLCGNGCVALPATMTNSSGKRIFVRIMDDLATTERSRWELWAEVNHGRVDISSFDRALKQEIEFIRSEQQTPTKKTQVAWSSETAKWYPVAASILRQLVVDPQPVEFATELLMPFTFEFIRDAEDPWLVARRLCPGKYSTLFEF